MNTKQQQSTEAAKVLDTNCPQCNGGDNKPYITESGIAMRACFRCLIQWRDPAGIAHAQPDAGVCEWCARGEPRIRSSVSDAWVHSATSIGRVVCPTVETPAEAALRSLASYVGNGGYNAPTVDAKEFEAKIRDGIDALIRVEQSRQPAPDAGVAEAVEVVEKIAKHKSICPHSIGPCDCEKEATALRTLINNVQHSRLPADEPVDVILFCPKCKEQHIDKAEPDVCENCGVAEGEHGWLHDTGACRTFTAWLNPPHKKHRCHSCNHVWKAAAIPTNGVAEITPPPTEKEERDERR